MSDETTGAPELDLAYYSERALAFGIDVSLAVLGYLLTLKVAFPQHDVLLNPHAVAWSWLWIGLFIVYQAFANAHGRTSWGKALMGIRVCDLEGKPLSLGQSSARSAGYLVSGVSYLGFVWPLFNQRVQAWHDLLAKTLVVQKESRAGRPLVVAGAWAVVAVVLTHWAWVFVLSGPYYRVRTIANAHAGLDILADLERRYYKDNGEYTGNLFALADVSGRPQAFLASMGMIFDTSRGLSLEPRGQGVRISAFARDRNSTPVQLDLP